MVVTSPLGPEDTYVLSSIERARERGRDLDYALGLSRTSSGGTTRSCVVARATSCAMSARWHRT